MPNTQKLLTLLFTIILGLGIQSCSSPGLDGGSETQGADGSNTGGANDLDGNGQADGVSTISITVDASLVMQTNESTRLFERIGEDSIRIRELNFDADNTFRFRADTSEVSLNNVERDENDNSGNTFIVEFTEGIASREQLNIAIEVRLPNQKNLYALLYETGGTNTGPNESIVVSARTTYLYKLLFENIDSTNELNTLLPCVNVDNCDNQYYAKYAVFRSLFPAIQSLDLGGEITEQSLDFDETIQLLDDNIPLRQSLTANIQSLFTQSDQTSNTIAPYAYGTRRESIPLDGSLRTRLGNLESYNSSYFSVGLDRTGTEISVAKSSQRAPFNGSPRIVPRIEILNSYLREQTSIINRSEIPYSFKFLDLLTDEESNQENLFLGTLPSRLENFPDACKDTVKIANDTRQTRVGEIVASRAIPQQIPSCISGLPTTGTRQTGWTHDPIFSLLYKSNEHIPDTSISNLEPIEIPEFGDSPTWLTTAYSSRASAFDLTRETEGFERGAKQKEIDLFGWELHGLVPSANPSDNVIRDRDYGSISLRLELDGESVAVHSEVLQWRTSNRSITESLPSTDSDDAYSATTLSRQTGASPALTTVTDIERTFLYTPTPVDGAVLPGVYSFDDANQVTGHISVSGGQIAFTDSDRERGTDILGTGLTFATELRTSGTVFQDTEIFKLQGNIIQLAETYTKLYNLNGSTLSFSNNSAECSAVLQIQYTSTQRALPGQSALDSVNEVATGFPTSSTPSPVVDLSPLFVTSDSCSIDSDGAIVVSFSEALQENMELTLRGFISRPSDTNSTEPGNLISLVWDQPEAQGLIFAQKDQQIQVEFDN